jgi:hypothetical protein
MSVAQMAAFLQDALGQRLVAYMTGLKDAKQVSRWSSGANAPRPETEKRLRAAMQVFGLLQEVESPHVIRAWFVGINPQLEDRAPVDAIREGEFRDVLAAARAFRSGG